MGSLIAFAELALTAFEIVFLVDVTCVALRALIRDLSSGERAYSFSLRMVMLTAS